MKRTDEWLEKVRKKGPLVHFITNYVTVNDCANMTLACGGSPIMADEIKEVEQITAACSALVLNIGTINERTLGSMLRAGRHANNLGIPVLLDPVGVGASDFRSDSVSKLLKEVNFSAIKGNISEIKFLYYGITARQGVDAAEDDMVNEQNLEDTMRFIHKLSVMTGAVIAVTGAIDLVADDQTGYALRDGHAMMRRVTGTGCMLGAAAGCFLGADHGCHLEAMLTATAAVGVCGRMAYEKLERMGGGTAAYRSLLIDEMSAVTDAHIIQHAHIQKVI